MLNLGHWVHQRRVDIHLNLCYNTTVGDSDTVWAPGCVAIFYEVNSAACTQEVRLVRIDDEKTYSMKEAQRFLASKGGTPLEWKRA